jgi:16S rRNA (adenine1518-N6/adenine1519-N6)-dimethyltransferase
VVPKTAFEPIPKVESAVVQLIPKHIFDAQEDRALFRIVRAGFSARRKTLVNNLMAILHLEKQPLLTILQHLGIREDARAQALSVKQWKDLKDAL